MRPMWILVADSSSARLYSRTSRRAPLTEVNRFSHPEARAKSGEIYADAPGRVHDRFGAGRHAVDTRSDLRTQEHERFARELADYLARGHHEGAYGRLVLMAPPAFLGALRGQLKPTLAGTVAGEVPKNLVAADEAGIVGHLPDGL